MGETGSDRYRDAADRIMARSATRQGTMADQLAGDAAAGLGLRRTAALAEAMGRPQDDLVVVHVAGTKGKGSTVAFISAILLAGGHRVGRMTSPHLLSLTERITIDERDIDPASFAEIADRVLVAAGIMERDQLELGPVNALEILFVMALVAFREARCRVAVIEVGIGGRLDTTNIVVPAVSVITTLDLEHTAILGDTLVAIASEKAGIIKPGRPVVVAPQPEEALTVIRARAEASGSRLTVVSGPPDWISDSPIGLGGDHQVTNASLAIAAVVELVRVDADLAVAQEAIREGLREAWLPGRFEIVSPGEADAAVTLPRWPDVDRPVVILDGAHTPRAATALRSSMPSGFLQSADTVVVCGFASAKDVRAFLAELGPAAIPPVMAVSPRALPAGDIASLAAGLGIQVLTGPTGVGDGIRLLLRSVPALHGIVVTGSFAVVAEARVALGLPPSRPDRALSGR